MNITAEYFPSIAELTDTQMSAARQFVVGLLQAEFSDTELAPGTPTGDLVVNALAGFTAATDEAHNRLLSDLNLENVANNIIYSCNFVQAYLGNFGVYDVENLRSSGVARLTFSANDTYTVGKNAVFRFGNTDDYTPTMGNSELSGIVILPSTAVPDGSDDTYILSQTSASTWSVDIPVTGVLVTAVTRGESGSSTWTHANLTSIAAAIDFLPGVPAAGLPELAKLARAVNSSLTQCTRSGIRSSVLRNWPEMRMTSPIITGDAEMQRTIAGSVLAISEPAVDLYIRSARDLQTETQTLKLYLKQVTVGGGTENRFRGPLTLLHRPSKITSIAWAGGGGLESFNVYTKSTHNELPGSLYCGTRYESLWVDAVPSMDPDFPESTVVDLLEDEEGLYAYFTVTYIADPLVGTVASVMESTDNAPLGVSLLVKSGPLAVIESMSISYRKAPGTKMLLTSAASAIESYVNACGYPYPFRETALHDIMKTAGASMVTGISMSGSIYVSPADRRFPAGVGSDPSGADAAADWELMTCALSDAGVIQFSSADDMLSEYVVNEEVGTDTADLELWASSERTIRTMIAVGNITFTEV